MFFSRPKLQPLGWDMKDFRHAGGFEFAGRTSSDQPVRMKYRGGWLTVWRGAADEAEPGPSDEMFSVSIGPPNHGTMLAEQLCDILGLTIEGRTVTLPEEKRRLAMATGPLLDWSGRTTYWHSECRVGDGENMDLMQALASTFPDLIPLRIGLENDKLRCRELRQLSDAAEIVSFCYCGNPSTLNKLTTADTLLYADLDDAFSSRIGVTRSVLQGNGSDPLNKADTGDAGMLPAFEIVPSERLVIEGYFRASDPHSPDRIARLENFFCRRFSKAFQHFDLETGHAVSDVLDDGPFEYYSNQLKDACLAAPDRYMKVGVWKQTDERNPAIAKRGTVFYGTRPVAAAASKTAERRRITLIFKNCAASPL